jgi:hypothetical protein
MAVKRNGGCRPAMVFTLEFWVGFAIGATVAVILGRFFGLF